MTTQLPEVCPYGCGALPEPKEDQDFGPGGYDCGSAIVPGEPKEESGHQSLRCQVTCLTRSLATANGKLEEIRKFPTTWTAGGYYLSAKAILAIIERETET